MESEYNLLIKGFKTKEQAKAFIDWYGGQGEQDAIAWFENLQDKGKIDVDFMPVDCRKGCTWLDNTLVAHLNIENEA